MRLFGEIVGITYRPVKEQQLSEIVFCAVSADHQVQGYGTRIMNQIKEECKRTGIEGMLTYADNHAVGYFRKQGFKKNVIMKRERWQGYLKDYEGATLMECLVDPSIDYLSTRKVAEKQRIAVEKRIAELAGSSRDGSGKDGSGKDKEEANKEKLKTGWKPPKIEIKRIVGPLAGDEVPLQQYLTELVNGVAAHEDAWPFQMPVSITEAPDYYTVIKTPVDLSLIRKRLAQEGKPYYLTPEQLHNDLFLMCENCKVYNNDTTQYWQSANRLEEAMRQRMAEVSIRRTKEE